MKLSSAHLVFVLSLLSIPGLGWGVNLSPSYIEWDVTAGSGGDDGQLLVGGSFQTEATWDYVALDLNIPLYFTRSQESESLEWRNTDRASAILGWFDRLEIQPPIEAGVRRWRVQSRYGLVPVPWFRISPR